MRLRAEAYAVSREKIAGRTVRVIAYRIEGRYHCRVGNLDPGAIVARADAPQEVQARQLALKKAASRLAPSGRGPAPDHQGGGGPFGS